MLRHVGQYTSISSTYTPEVYYVLPAEGNGPLESSKNSESVSVRLTNPIGLCSRLNLGHTVSFRHLPHTYISSFGNQLRQPRKYYQNYPPQADTALDTRGADPTVYTQFRPQQTTNLLTSSWQGPGICAALPHLKIRSLRKKDTDSSTKLTDG